MQQTPNPFVTRILWLVLIVSQCIYLVIPSPRSGEGVQPMFVTVLAVVAVTQAVGVFAYFRWAGVGKVQAGDIDPSTAEGMGRLFVVLIMTWVVIESIAIYGLVLRFMGASFFPAVLFSLGAFALMGATHPWQAGLKAPVDTSDRGQDSTPIA